MAIIVLYSIVLLGVGFIWTSLSSISDKIANVSRSVGELEHKVVFHILDNKEDFDDINKKLLDLEPKLTELDLKTNYDISNVEARLELHGSDFFSELQYLKIKIVELEAFMSDTKVRLERSKNLVENGKLKKGNELK